MRVFTNTVWADVKPVLSILVPFLRDDPAPLLAALADAAGSTSGPYEVVLLDDGTNDAVLTQNIKDRFAILPFATAFLSSAENLGRSVGRNLLAEHARGQYILFVDADMLPDSPHFVEAWLRLIATEKPEVAFGGFSVLQASTDPAYAVHKSMAAKSDCLSAAKRQQQPEKYVFTSNLLVRGDVFKLYPFDASFRGWGWEDVEWAMRVTREHTILHTDNTATHMGLDTVPALMNKYVQSARNFVRVVENHPELVAGYPSYRIAKMIRQWHLSGLVVRSAALLAQIDGLPVAARALALRFYRSALYAKALAGE